MLPDEMPAREKNDVHAMTNITPALDAVVMRALAKEPMRRFATAGEFEAALKGALAGSSTEAS